MVAVPKQHEVDMEYIKYALFIGAAGYVGLMEFELHRRIEQRLKQLKETIITWRA